VKADFKPNFALSSNNAFIQSVTNQILDFWKNEYLPEKIERKSAFLMSLSDSRMLFLKVTEIKR